MKRKRLYLLLIMVLSASFLISCSKEDNNENEGIVPSLTGAITKEGINFDNPKLECTKCIITLLPNTKVVSREYGSPATMTLQFNDNMEVVFKGIADSRDEKIASKVYRLLKNCYPYSTEGAYVAINLLKDGKIVSSETLAPPTGSWWEMARDDSYFTISLDLKGKEMIYKGQIKYTFDEQ